MANEFREAGQPRGMTPARTKALMALVAVITIIAVWLVPVDEQEEATSLPGLPAAPGTSEPLPLPGEPGMSGTMPPSSARQPGPAQPAFTESLPEPESPDSESLETLALPAPPGGIGTVTSGGEGARTFLYEQRAGGARPDPDVVFAEAERRRGQGNLEDAYLLYRYAARHGQAQAAMTLGTQADPAYHDTASSYLPEPEPGQALKWYSAAAEAGDEEAVQRLQALREYTEREAADGDEQARRLLLQWR